MATADYIRGVAQGHKELLGVIVGWLKSSDNNGGVWTVLQDFVDNGAMNNDGERNIILRGDIPGELPIFIGLRTFAGYEGKNQAGIQINAYTNFDADLPWDCQAGSLADPAHYISASHFYENCPAILVGGENVCYWIQSDAKHLKCAIRTPTIPMTSADTDIRKSVVYEMFYLGWMQRIVSKEGYPYPMAAQGTTYTLGNSDLGYVQRNFAYNNKLGSIRHLPPFHHDYMFFEGIQPMVYLTLPTTKPGTIIVGNDPNLNASKLAFNPTRNPLAVRRDGGQNANQLWCERNTTGIPVGGVSGIVNENPVCGPDLGICFDCTAGAQWELKDSQIGIKMFQYDVANMANRAMYFDGTWGWTCGYPVRNAYIKSICWCMQRMMACGSYNAFRDMGCAPPLSAISAGIRKDQVAAHFGWNPDKVVDSLSGHRLLVPCYMGIVGSIADMQSKARETFVSSDMSADEMYREEQLRIQIAGVLDGLYYVPGLGLSAQDVLKINEGGKSVTYIALPDVYRDGPFNFCAMKLGVTEWHETNPGKPTPSA